MDYCCRLIDEDGALTVEFPDLPNAVTYGHTIDEALAMAAEAMNGALESDISHGFALPELRTGPGHGLYPVHVEPHILVAWELRKLRGGRPQSEIAARLGLTIQIHRADSDIYS